MDIIFVYFVYGLAFFSMGIALLFESTRSPSLARAEVLRPLAFFGFIHGAHEWMEMFVLSSGWLVISNPGLGSWLRIGVLTGSFISLLTFALLMLWPDSPLVRWELVSWSTAAGLYLVWLIVVLLSAGRGHQDRIAHVDVAIRWMLAAPAAVLTAAALLCRAGEYRAEGRPQLGAGLRVAAIGFIVYGLSQSVVPPTDVFPSSVWNTQAFLTVFGFPIQIVRAGAAVLITLSLAQAVNALERDRQAQFLAAQRARLEALEQLEIELRQRESMRQELLRHIVLAQEDERARIARELHDETSQLLTAFTFHLATLRQSVSRSKARDQLDYLQSLSRQMSQGLYRLVRDLRPAQLDDLGLVAALQYLVDEQEKRTGLVVDLRVSGEKRRLDNLLETVLFRVAQEALTNVARHSGVNTAAMHLSFQSGQVGLLVEDGGRGFDLRPGSPAIAGLGLAGMRERVESIGGRLAIDATPGAGVRVEVRVPVDLVVTNSVVLAVPTND